MQETTGINKRRPFLWCITTHISLTTCSRRLLIFTSSPPLTTYKASQSANMTTALCPWHYSSCGQQYYLEVTVKLLASDNAGLGWSVT